MPNSLKYPNLSNVKLTLGVGSVRVTLGQFLTIILQQHLVSWNPLDGCQHVMLQCEIIALRETLDTNIQFSITRNVSTHMNFVHNGGEL